MRACSGCSSSASLHFYFIWFGDILAAYALIGLILFFFRNLSVRALVIWGVVFVAARAAADGRRRRGAAAARRGRGSRQSRSRRSSSNGGRCSHGFSAAAGQELADKLALFLGPLVRPRPRPADRALASSRSQPSILLRPETLAYMLFGMAALKIGFLRGEWDAGALPQMGADLLRHRDPRLCAARLAAGALGLHGARRCSLYALAATDAVPAADDRRLSPRSSSC